MASYATSPFAMRARASAEFTTGALSRTSSACTRSTGANCSAVVLRTVGARGEDMVGTVPLIQRADTEPVAQAASLRLNHDPMTRTSRHAGQSGSYVALSDASSATVTRVTFTPWPSVAWTRSQMNRARFSPVGTSCPSPNSGTSRLMLQ